MKKPVFLIVLFLVVGYVFAQNYTFQGLPWGSTREQVIAKLGKPDGWDWNNTFDFHKWREENITIIQKNYANIREAIQKNYANVLNNMIRFDYDVNVNGYLSTLSISFDANGMSEAFYNIGRYQRLNSSQLLIAFGITADDIIKKYGAYNEVIIEGALINNNEEQHIVWHFNNFHIMTNTIVADSNSLLIHYFSNTAWNSIEKIIKNEKWTRFPNSGL